MIIKEKIGNINNLQQHNKHIDWLKLEWYEASKRIMRKQTDSGVEVVFKFMNEAQHLTEGDVLFEDEHSIIAVDIIPCEAIVIQPETMFEIASVCYEIGNKHLPLFYEGDTMLTPFDLPLFRLLSVQGYKVIQEQRKLLQPLNTTVSPHGVSLSGETIFSKIMKVDGGV